MAISNLYKIKVGENIYSLGVTNVASDSVAGLMSSTQVRDLKNIQNTIGKISDDSNQNTIYGKLNELSYLITENSNNVSLKKEYIPELGFAATYTLSQGNNEIGKINIPLDYLVRSGKVVNVISETITNEETQELITIYKEQDSLFIIPEGLVTESGKYIKFVVNSIDDSANNRLMYIKVSDLVDIFTYELNASEIQLNISSTNEISASIVNNSITKNHLSQSLRNEIEAATTAIGNSESGIIKKISDLENSIINQKTGVEFVVDEENAMLEIKILTNSNESDIENNIDNNTEESINPNILT